MQNKDVEEETLEQSKVPFDLFFFYPLHKDDCGVMEQDVKAGEKTKPPSKRCVKRDDLSLWWCVKGLFKIKVAFMVSCHQLTIGAV